MPDILTLALIVGGFFLYMVVGIAVIWVINKTSYDITGGFMGETEKLFNCAIWPLWLLLTLVSVVFVFVTWPLRWAIKKFL